MSSYDVSAAPLLPVESYDVSAALRDAYDVSAALRDAVDAGDMEAIEQAAPSLLLERMRQWWEDGATEAQLLLHVKADVLNQTDPLLADLERFLANEENVVDDDNYLLCKETLDDEPDEEEDDMLACIDRHFA